VKQAIILTAVSLTVSAMFALPGYGQQSPQPAVSSKSLQELAKDTLNPVDQ